VRTLDAFDFIDEELHPTPRWAPAGGLFKLQNLEDLPGSTEAADRLVGHRVVAKGILVRHESGTRLNVAALNVVGDTCEP
jgi:hypothetical protein